MPPVLLHWPKQVAPLVGVNPERMDREKTHSRRRELRIFDCIATLAAATQIISERLCHFLVVARVKVRDAGCQGIYLGLQVLPHST